MGGQACVIYGAAEFSRDTDLVVLAETNNLRRLQQALTELQALRIAVPPFEQRYLSNHFVKACQVTARPARAMEVVNGISFGQTLTQFWALPQTWMPPSAINASRRSLALCFPRGWELNSMTWLMA